jgi:hypothetical protein
MQKDAQCKKTKKKHNKTTTQTTNNKNNKQLTANGILMHRSRNFLLLLMLALPLLLLLYCCVLRSHTCCLLLLRARVNCTLLHTAGFAVTATIQRLCNGSLLRVHAHTYCYCTVHSSSSVKCVPDARTPLTVQLRTAACVCGGTVPT